MPAVCDADGAFQARFARRWGRLNHPHVRALAWLLDSPDLLDAASPHWGGRIAALADLEQQEQKHEQPAIAAWLDSLERDPAPLEAALGAMPGGKPYTRLGLYAEKLMAFYFEQHGLLAAHGLQVRASRNDTVGEFDFLLRAAARLLHWEFATKFYLLDDAPDVGPFDRLIGPNLADTLGLKMRKILDQQLALSRHPAAQALLPQAVDRAQALVKGWLFYRAGRAAPAIDGIAPDHCRGTWCGVSEFAADEQGRDERCIAIARMQWLAPLKAACDAPTFARDDLAADLRVRFALDGAPVQVATVAERDGALVETARCFVVPDDWAAQARARRAAGKLPR